MRPVAVVLIWLWRCSLMMEPTLSTGDRLLGTEFYILVPNKLPEHCLFHLHIFEPALNGIGATIEWSYYITWLETKVFETSRSYHTEELARNFVGGTYKVTANSDVGITLRISCDFAQTGSGGEIAEYRAVPSQFWTNNYFLALPANALCATVLVLSTTSTTYTINIRKGPSAIDFMWDSYIEIYYWKTYLTAETVTIDTVGVYAYSTFGYYRLQITSVYWDLTGSTIQSEDPFEAIVVPSNRADGCMAEKLFAEQMMAPHAWDTEYLIPLGTGDTQTNVNVVAMEANTTVQYSVINGSSLSFNSSAFLPLDGDVLPIQYISGSTQTSVDVIRTSKAAMVVASYHSVYTPDLDLAFTQLVPLTYHPLEVTLFLHADYIQDLYLVSDSGYDLQTSGYLATYTYVSMEQVGNEYLATGFGFNLTSSTSDITRWFINGSAGSTLGVSGVVVSHPAVSAQTLAAHAMGWSICPLGTVYTSGYCEDLVTTTSMTTTDSVSETTTGGASSSTISTNKSSIVSTTQSSIDSTTQSSIDSTTQFSINSTTQFSIDSTTQSSIDFTTQSLDIDSTTLSSTDSLILSSITALTSVSSISDYTNPPNDIDITTLSSGIDSTSLSANIDSTAPISGINSTTLSSIIDLTTSSKITTSMTVTENSYTSSSSGSSNSSSSSISRQCPCKCTNQMKTQKERLDAACRQTIRIIENLRVNKSELINTRMKLESATDNRTSAQTIGALGIAVMAVTGGLVLLGDLTVLFSLKTSCG